MTLLLSILIIFLLCVGFLFWFIQRMRRNTDASTTLSALVRIPKNGSPSVEFSPEANITSDRLIKITVLYIAKLYHVLADDAHGARKVLDAFLVDLVKDQSDFEDILIHSERTLASIGREMGDSPRAALEIADYRIRLVEGFRTFVNNDLPVFPRDLLGNVPISALLLLNAAAKRLPPSDQIKLGRVLHIFVDNVVISSDVSGLFALNQAGLDAIAATTN